MKRRRVLVIVVLVFVAAVIAVLVWPGEREPEYQGRKLSEWLDTAYDNPRGSPEREVAMKAIGQIGTNALPYLLRAITYTDSPSKKKILSAVRAIPNGPTWIEAAGGDENRRVYPAVLGFRALGPAAGPAVPRLLALINGTNGDAAERAMRALGMTGRPGITYLLPMVQNTGFVNRGRAAFWLTLAYQFADALDEGAPVIRACLKDKDVNIVIPTMFALMDAAPSRPDFVVPSFIDLTRHTNARVRYVAVEGLRRYGKNAQPSVGALEKCCDDPDSFVRQAATNALRFIAPEELERLKGH